MVRNSTELSKLASKLLSLPPTSAAVERLFSRYSWIHSTKRNRLSTERAAKLVYVAHNLSLTDSSMPSALFPGTTAAATSPHASPCEEGDRLSKPTMTELLEDSESLTESDSESEIRDRDFLCFISWEWKQWLISGVMQGQRDSVLMQQKGRSFLPSVGYFTSCIFFSLSLSLW